MKLLLVSLLGLVTMTAAQLSSEDFAVYWNGTEDNDIQGNATDQSQTEATDLVQELKSASQSGEYNNIPENVTRYIPLPPSYRYALTNTTSMFDDNSANNQLVTKATTATRSAPSRQGRQTSFMPYHCPHKTHLLRWFPVVSNGLAKPCFVPWGLSQNITYAQCLFSKCKVWNGDNAQGGCRPSCYQRRFILALCYVSHNTWVWRWELRYLPQTCLCSTC